MTKRRTFSPEFKTKVVLELISGEKGLMEASREYQIKDTVLSRWKQQFLAQAPQIFERSRKVDPQEERIAELERVAGRMALELEMAKKVYKRMDHRRKSEE